MIILATWLASVTCEECGTLMQYGAEDVVADRYSSACSVQCPTCKCYQQIAEPPPFVRRNAQLLPREEQVE